MNDAAKHRPGTVYLVGAGPGDADLITVRGLHLLQNADVIVYDRLVHPDLLRQAPASAILVNVGKNPEHHPIPQPEINHLLVHYAKEHKTVVRLKGGDPFVFGRGGEEALTLAENHIPFEVVPGITAAIAAPAYAGIPVTHRDYAAAFTLITGHEKDAEADRETEARIDWPALARSSGTLAFYMGVKNLPNIVQNLLCHGMKGVTPAAIIEQGTTPRQRTILGTLDSLIEQAEQAEIRPPAMIIIGTAALLHEKLNWFESLPLFGQKVLITRTRMQASELAKRLYRLGAEPIEFPTIAIAPITPNPALDDALRHLDRFQWLIFTSANAVDIFIARMTSLRLDARSLRTVRIAAIGPATAEKLRQYQLIADLTPEEYVAEALVAALQQSGSLAGNHVLIPRSADARPELVKQLNALAAHVQEIPLYHTPLPDNAQTEPMRHMLRANQLHWLTFTSSSAVRNFFGLVSPDLVRESTVKIASIGPITSQTLRELQMPPHCQASAYTIDGLVDALCTYRS